MLLGADGGGDGGGNLFGDVVRVTTWGGAGGRIFETLQSIAVGITTVIVVVAGLALFVATFILPAAAAKEMEMRSKELAPELWDDYQRKLEPGQTIAQRPDLMEELGAQLEPLLDAKIAQEMARQQQPQQPQQPPSSPAADANDDDDDDRR